MSKWIGSSWVIVLVIVILIVLPAVSQAALQTASPTLSEVVIDLNLPDAVDVVLFGDDALDRFGTDLATGDLNGDGIADVAVGAFGGDGPNDQRDDAGEVHVYYGKSADDWMDEDNSPDITIFGAHIQNYLGSEQIPEPGHIAFGDIDDDGTEDLIVGASYYGYKTSYQNRGRAWIIWGGQDLPSEIDLKSPPSEVEITTITPGEAPPDAPWMWIYMGEAVATGDFNADGVDDVAVSAPDADGDAGAIYVFFGGAHLRDRVVVLDEVPDDVKVFEAQGGLEDRKLGSYLVFGDFSGDGVDDLAVGADLDRTGYGTVHVLFGGDEVDDGVVQNLVEQPANWSVDAEEGGGRLGSSLAAGDFNDDDHTDLLIGARSADAPAGRDAGQAIGILGPVPDDTVRNLDNVPGDLIIYGPQGGLEFAYLGESVTIGDFDGDGTGDVMVGARNVDALERNGAGAVYVFYGSEALVGLRDLRETPADITFIGAQSDDRTGYVTSGDVTGDGIDDMIFSADWRDSPESGINAGAVYIEFGSETQPPTATSTPTGSVMPTSTATPTSTPTLTPTPTPSVTPEPAPEVRLPLIMRNFGGDP